MNLKDLLRVAKKNLVIVFLTSSMGVISAFFYVQMQVPMYRSEVQLFVTTPASSADFGALVQGSTFSEQRIKSYSQIINSPIVLIPVIAKLNLTTTPTQLAKQISAQAPVGTVLINLVVNNPDPNLASNIANAVGDQFEKTVSQLEFGLNSESIRVSVVTAAQPASGPASPRTKILLLLGLLIGFSVGFGVAILRVIFDQAVKSYQDLLDFPLLAVIGFDEAIPKKPLLKDLDTYSPYAESIRYLRTNVVTKNNSAANGQVVVMSSSLPGEGKTTQALNLATSLGQAGFKTLYIEADLRRPSSHKYLKTIRSVNGVSNLLFIGRNITISKSRVLKQIKTGIIDSCSYLPAGKLTKKSVESLNAEQISTLYGQLRKSFDFIVVDTPPILPVSDAKLLSENADQIILIVKAGSTRKSHFRVATESLGAHNRSRIGVILNMVPLGGRDYEDYGYRYDYGAKSYGNYKSLYKYIYGISYTPGKVNRFPYKVENE